MCKSLHYFSSPQKAFAFLFSWGRGRWTPGKEAGTMPSLRSWCGWESRIWAERWLLCVSCYCFTLCARPQSRLSLWDPTDCSSPSFPIRGMFQARLLEWRKLREQKCSQWFHWDDFFFHWNYLKIPCSSLERTYIALPIKLEELGWVFQLFSCFMPFNWFQTFLKSRNKYTWTESRCLLPVSNRWC